ncbi:MAG: cellulose synthase/poly-beta-1,6-N-acetylglucosamine synthase-like glycosyltransferase, partial [Flavobacteriales bacterium]
MDTLKITFWSLLFIIVYTYVGYGVLLYVIIKIRRFFKVGKKVEVDYSYEPEVTLFIAAYNEKDYVAEKMKNTLSLDYPKEKLNIVWVTDGSDDGTPDLLKDYPNTTVHHLAERNGKIGAMNRGVEFVRTPIVIFSDANTNLGKESIRRIVNLFNDSSVGCVSGEKRIVDKESDVASGAGEGIYWKYESALKKWDAELYSVVGAAGELFAIRTALYKHVEKDTIL